MSENQWNQIHRINQILFDDYKTRRELLLKRLDVTVQSFKWADRLKVTIDISMDIIFFDFENLG
jgi:protein FAM98B